MPRHLSSTIVLVLLVGLAHTGALAADRCAARVSAKTGAIEVSASGVTGTPTWSGSADVDGVAFANAQACVVGERLRRCRLGAIGTLAEITPPSECRVCVHDGADAPCCAFIRGCTPGPRLKDASFATGDPRVCQGLGATDPACGPVGIWERTSGLLALGYISTDLMVLQADGTATLSARSPAGLACTRALHTKGAGNEVLLDASFLGTGHATLFQFRTPSANDLDLVDSSGGVVSFTRRDEVPGDLACGELQILARFSNLPRGRGSALAFDGSALWYSDENGREVSVDAATGTPGPTLDLPGVVEAASGQTFWMTQIDLTRRQDATQVSRSGAVLDVVTTPAVAGDEPSVAAVAVDPRSDRIFLATSGQDGTRSLLGVRTAGEPDTFTTLGQLGQDYASLAFDGTDLWAVPFRSNNLVRLDAQTGAELQTFLLPGGVVRWNAVAAGTNGDLFILGLEATGSFAETAGVIVRVRP
jgi:hypothetical protein